MSAIKKSNRLMDWDLKDLLLLGDEWVVVSCRRRRRRRVAVVLVPRAIKSRVRIRIAVSGGGRRVVAGRSRSRRRHRRSCRLRRWFHRRRRHGWRDSGRRRWTNQLWRWLVFQEFDNLLHEQQNKDTCYRNPMLGRLLQYNPRRIKLTKISWLKNDISDSEKAVLREI